MPCNAVAVVSCRVSAADMLALLSLEDRRALILTYIQAAYAGLYSGVYVDRWTKRLQITIGSLSFTLKEDGTLDVPVRAVRASDQVILDSFPAVLQALLAAACDQANAARVAAIVYGLQGTQVTSDQQVGQDRVIEFEF